MPAVTGAMIVGEVGLADSGQGLARESREQLPGEIQGLDDAAVFVLALANELAIEIAGEFEIAPPRWVSVESLRLTETDSGSS